MGLKKKLGKEILGWLPYNGVRENSSRNQFWRENMNATRLVGMAMAIVGFIVEMISWGFSVPVRMLLGLYFGLTLFVVGLLVYAVGSFREAQTKRRLGT